MDVLILNDSRGANGHGHQAIAVGNDESGWDYYSKDGYGSENQRHVRYNSREEMYYDVDETGQYSSKSARYDRRGYIETSPDQDQKMKEYADEHYNDPYSCPGNHCNDLVTDTLDEGEVSTGEKPFMNEPNESFENIVEANQPEDETGRADRKKNKCK